MTKKKLKPAAGYLRCSTSKQDTSVEDQKTAILAYAKKHGYKIVVWYSDDGISGDDTENRTDFLRMRDDLHNGDFDFVLCWDQDRFGRFDSLDAGYWIKPFRDAGVQLVTLNDGAIDWEDFAGRIMYSLKQEGKHQYLIDLSRNVVRGQMEAAKAGSWIGSIPYAYQLVGKKKNKRLVLGDENEVNIVKRIFREYAEDGRKMSEICTGLNADGIISPGGKEWRYDGIRSLLKNPVYIGTYRYNVNSRAKYYSNQKDQITEGKNYGPNPESDQTIILDHHEAIIDKEVFQTAQDIATKGRTGRSPYTSENNPFVFSGKLQCGRCGAPLWGMDHNGVRYYRCSRQRAYKDCEGTSVRENEVLECLRKHIQKEFPYPHSLQEKAERGELTQSDIPKSFAKIRRLVLGDEKKKTDPKRIKKQLQQIGDKIGKVKRNLALVDPEFIAGLQDQIREMESQKDSLQKELSNQPTEMDINKAVERICTKLVFLGLSLKLAQIRGKTTSRIIESAHRYKPLQKLLMEIDNIVLHTEVKGYGNGIRHIFKNGEIHYRRVGVVIDKLNPQTFTKV